MAETPEPDATHVAWEMLLNGWGYNWYRRDNQMRADDLLIRSRACDCLHRAAASLRTLEARHRELYLPPPSREAPYPDAARMAQLRAIRAVRESVEAVEVRVRDGAAPADDKIWQRHRDNAAMLAHLVEADAALVWAAQRLEAAAAATALPPKPTDLAAVEQAVAALARSLGERRALLEFPVPLTPEAARRFDV